VDSELTQFAMRIAESRGQDREAANGLSRLLFPRLVLILSRAERDHDAAHDLAQEALLEVLGALAERKIDDPSKVAAYARSVSRTAALSAGRTRERCAELLARYGIGDPVQDAPAFTQVDYAALGRCLAVLAYRERQTLFMTYAMDSPIEDIASLLETTAGNIRVIRHRAFVNLRRCLGLEA
jgi:RNA polymerase sigma factor (sigma-70 family)